MKMTRKKGEPPSRIRYESTHPTIACRVSREIYDRLQEVRLEGLSLTDIMKTGLEMLEPKIQKVQQARNGGYEAGYREGYQQAEQRYKVIYPCRICGQSIEIKSDKEKQSAATYMRGHGWAHTTCLNRNR